MPLYEYRCRACDTCFDALRSMAEADAPIACPGCRSTDTCRLISLFAARSDKGVIAGASCSSCTPSGACATCPSKH